MAKLIGDEYANVSASLTDIGAKSNLYRSEEDSQRLYFTPYFAFAADAEGVPEITQQTPYPGETSHSIQLRLLISPEEKLSSMAAHVRNSARGEYQDLRRTDLIPIPMQRLSIVQIIETSTFFQPVYIRNTSLQSEVIIESMPLTKEAADKLTFLLRSGERNPSFLISYELDVVFRESYSTASVDSINAYTTKAVQQLVGKGRAFQWKVDGATGVIGENDLAITRDQKSEFEGELQKEIKMEYVISDPEDLDVLRNSVDEYVNSALLPILITPTQNFAADIAKLSAYNFDPKDLSPDQLNNLASSVEDAFKNKDHTKVDFKLAGQAGFLGIEASANTEFSLDYLKERMEKKGWEFGTDEANITLPKGFKVFVLNKTKIRQNGEFAISIKRVRDGITRLDAKVSLKNILPSSRLSTKSVACVPLGGIIDWYPIDGKADIPYGFQLCDKSKITDERSPYFGKETPQLVDRFLMGVTTSRIGETGGHNSLPIDGEHDHGGITKGDAIGFAGNIRLVGGDIRVSATEHQHEIKNVKGHNHGGENRPRYTGVLKIMRIL